jgi:isoamylase
VTCHDGLTLRDLVSYQSKHNEANGENNRDGTDQNDSWNCGIEGPTDDASINALRGRQQRNLLATLLLSQGVPMLLAGDESGHTQLGNNNAYCQDSPLTWLNWDLAPEQRKDLYWLTPVGTEMSDQGWNSGYARCLGMGLLGGQIDETNAQGERIVSDSFLILLNAHHECVSFRLGGRARDQNWELVFDTSSAKMTRRFSGPGRIPAAAPVGRGLTPRSRRELIA